MNLNQEVKNDFYFFLADGRVLKSGIELLNALKSMDESTFSHHVNKERNDFSNWIMYIYENKKLALNLKKCKNKEAVIKCLDRELKKNKEFRRQEKEWKKQQKQIEKENKIQEKEENKIQKIVPPRKKFSILGLLRGL